MDILQLTVSGGRPSFSNYHRRTWRARSHSSHRQHSLRHARLSFASRSWMFNIGRRFRLTVRLSRWQMRRPCVFLWWRHITSCQSCPFPSLFRIGS